MHIAQRIMFAATATIFSAIILLTIVVYGGHFARSLAVLAAFAGLVSQYAAQSAPTDETYRMVNLWADSLGLAIALIAVLSFIGGY